MSNEDELVNLMEQVMHLEHLLNVEKAKCRGLETSLADFKETNSGEIKELWDDLMKEKRNNIGLKAATAKKDAELNNLKHRAADCEAVDVKKSAEIESLKSELANMEALDVKKSAEIESLKRELANKEAVNVKKSAEVESLKHELANKEAINVKKSAEIESLKRELTNKESVNVMKSAEIKSLERELANERAANAKKSAEEVSLLYELANKQREVHTLEGAVEALKKKVFHLEFKSKIAKGVRIYVKQNPRCLLTVRGGKVIVAHSTEDDLHQYWIKNDRYGKGKKERFGCTAFALVNMGSGQALKPAKHGVETWESVHLVHFNPHVFDQSILWSQGKDRGHNYATLKKFRNVHSNLDVHGSEVHSGSHVGGYKYHQGRANQLWHIVHQK